MAALFIFAEVEMSGVNLIFKLKRAGTKPAL